MTERFEDGRYRISDEPRRLPGAAAGSHSMILVLPITLYCALTYHPLLLLLPGVLGFLIGGPHKWKDPLLAVLSVVIFYGFSIGINLIDSAYGLSDAAFAYSIDGLIAFSTLPLFFIVFGQQRTLDLRAASQR